MMIRREALCVAVLLAIATPFSAHAQRRGGGVGGAKAPAQHGTNVAHSGTFSLYIDGIKRCDRLCAELWQAIQNDPEYANKTTMFILPDFGRDADIDSGGNGFFSSGRNFSERDFSA